MYWQCHQEISMKLETQRSRLSSHCCRKMVKEAFCSLKRAEMLHLCCSGLKEATLAVLLRKKFPNIQQCDTQCVTVPHRTAICLSLRHLQLLIHWAQCKFLFFQIQKRLAVCSKGKILILCRCIAGFHSVGYLFSWLIVSLAF